MTRTALALLTDLLRLLRLTFQSRAQLCERLIGTARRECLDWVIPLTERHLRRVLAEWMPHYNRERPHAALSPGSQTRRTIRRRRLDIDCCQGIASWLARVSVVCTLTTDWNPPPHEFLRSTAATRKKDSYLRAQFLRIKS